MRKINRPEFYGIIEVIGHKGLTVGSASGGGACDDHFEFAHNEV